MPCQQWNDDWVAHLYDELSPEETAAMQAHLAVCEECSRELDSLAACRDFVGRHAPHVPETPRVVFIQGAGERRSWWTFAAGLAAAAVIFIVGVLAAPMLSQARPGVTPATHDDLVTLDLFEEALSRHFASVDSRLDEYDAMLTRATQAPQRTEQNWVTRQRFEQETADLLQLFEQEQANLMRRVDNSRARDLQMVYEELEATEARAMLAYVLRNDPRLSEK